MNHIRHMRQRALRKTECVWDKKVRMHSMLLPVFGSDYRVRGMIALSTEEAPLWYPGIPISLEAGRLTFKTGAREHPMGLHEVGPEAWEGSYYLDERHILERFLPWFGPGGEKPGPLNIQGGRIRGRKILDVVYEFSLHRVRWIDVRSGWLGSQLISVMSIPPLKDSLEPAPGMMMARGPFQEGESESHAPGGQAIPAEKPGLLERIIRQSMELDEPDTPPRP